MTAWTEWTNVAWPTKATESSHTAVAAAAAAKSLQSCLTLCDPIDSSPPGSPSLGFSRQEHWSGLPFPSPMHESEKWKWSCSVLSNSSRPHWLQPTRLLRPWDFPGQSTGVGCHCLLPVTSWESCNKCRGRWTELLIERSNTRVTIALMNRDSGRLRRGCFSWNLLKYWLNLFK